MRITHALAFIVITGCAAAPTPRNEPAAERPVVAPAISATTPSSETTESSAAAADPLPPSPIDVPPTAPTIDPSAAATASPQESPSDPKASPAEIKACAARGGKMEPVCMMQTLTCVIHYRDAGKRCFDKQDCIGACLYQESGPAPAHPVGACQWSSDPCGCKAPIIGGKVQPGICVD